MSHRTELYALSLHDALPICGHERAQAASRRLVRGFWHGDGRLCWAARCQALGLRPHIAVDLFDERLALARNLGATHTVNRSEEHTSELQSQSNLVCRLLLEK